MDALRIYIAGPYTAPTLADVTANVERAIDAGLAVWQKGHWPYIPHLTHWIDQRAQARELSITYDDYLALDMAWLRCCHALLLLAHSPGANRELAQATALRLRIFHTIEEIPTRFS
jgi:hypothetical protein